MNELQGQKQAGASNLWSGISGMASTAMDYAGTSYFNNTMAGMYGNQAPKGYSYGDNGKLTQTNKYGTFTFNG